MRSPQYAADDTIPQLVKRIRTDVWKRLLRRFASVASYSRLVSAVFAYIAVVVFAAGSRPDDPTSRVGDRVTRDHRPATEGLLIQEGPNEGRPPKRAQPFCFVFGAVVRESSALRRQKPIADTRFGRSRGFVLDATGLPGSTAAPHADSKLLSWLSTVRAVGGTRMARNGANQSLRKLRGAIEHDEAGLPAA